MLFMSEEPLISIAAAARAEGVSRQTLWSQVQSGAVRNHGGKVYRSEVREDRQRNVDKARAPTRGRTQCGRGVELDGDMFEAMDAHQWLLMDALAHSDADPVHLDFCEVTVSRDDARAIIAACRDWNRAVFQR